MIERATGSSGNAVQDGTVRGVIAAMLTGLLAFVQIEFDVISAEGAIALAPVATGVAFFVGGLYDRYVRARISPAP